MIWSELHPHEQKRFDEDLQHCKQFGILYMNSHRPHSESQHHLHCWIDYALLWFTFCGACYSKRSYILFLIIVYPLYQVNTSRRRCATTVVTPLQWGRTLYHICSRNTLIVFFCVPVQDLLPGNCSKLLFDIKLKHWQ